MKTKEVHNNVDYSYPNCGGCIIRESKDQYFVMYYSNYQGQRTNHGYSMLKKHIDKDIFIRWATSEILEYNYNMGDQRINRYANGWIVR